MNETLTPKQDTFCVHYTTIGAETFSNGTKSAIAAGYSEKGAYARGSELLRIRKVLERISELHTENMRRNMITVDKVLADLEHDKLMARQAGQYSVSLQCTIAQGKYLAMWTENVNTTDTIRQRELDAEEQAECAELARLRLASKYGLVKADVKAEERQV